MTTTTSTPGAPDVTRLRDITAFFVAACVITWLLGLPLALAWLRQEPPTSTAMLLAGLSAWGPTVAACIIAARLGAVRSVFGVWRTGRALPWLLVALAAPFALHLPATLLEVVLGGSPAQWWYPPATAEHVAALVMFSFGEEFGWRGFAYPRLADRLARSRSARFAPVVAALVVGAVWGVWHLVMMVTPEGAPPSVALVARFTVELALWSVIIAWLFERSGRNIMVAIAAHMGGHLDNVNRAPVDETRLQLLRFAVLAIAAAFAARALIKSHAQAGAARVAVL